MKNIFLSLRDYALLAVLYLVIMFSLAKLADTLWPATTILFVLFCTGCGLVRGWLNALLTVAGLVMYTLSWVALWNWGWSPTEAMWLCGPSILAWIGGVFSATLSFFLPQISVIRQRPV